MLRSKQRKANGQGELIPPSNVLDAIDRGLKEMCRMWPAKELSPEEISNWHRDLSVFPIAAINWAFENWRRNGRFFPVYGDIIDQCVAWEPTDQTKYKPGCSKECLARHGRGYNEVDVKNLYKLVTREVGANRPVVLESLLAELDSKRRCGPPDWRRV